VADAFYGGVPDEINAKVEEMLTPDLWEVTKAKDAGTTAKKLAR